MQHTAHSVWKNCLSFIEDNISNQAYKTWFEPIEAVSLTENSLSIKVPSKFFYEWLEEHYVELLKSALTKELGKGAKLVYSIKMENTQGKKKSHTESIPSTQRSNVSAQSVEFKSTQKNPGIQESFCDSWCSQS